MVGTKTLYIYIYIQGKKPYLPPRSFLCGPISVFWQSEVPHLSCLCGDKDEQDEEEDEEADDGDEELDQAYGDLRSSGSNLAICNIVAEVDEAGMAAEEFSVPGRANI